jgi:hypothetical protein
MARPIGAVNKHKPFRAALNRLLCEAGRDPNKLDLIALALEQKALGGDVAAIKEIADRLDGKVAQPMTGGDEGEEPIRIEQVQRVIYDPKDAV